MRSDNGQHPSSSGRTGLHVAIIMDGSGRWALERGLTRAQGHRAGRDAVCRVVKAALDRDVRVLTLFTFSTDNWGRPEYEVSELMRTFEAFFRLDAPALTNPGVRLEVIGRRDRLPFSLCDAIGMMEKVSSPNDQLHVR